MKYVKHISMDEGVKGYDLRQYNYVSNFDGMDFDKAQYEISDDKDYHDAVDEDGWKSIFKIAKKYKAKLKKHNIKSDKDLENFAKWLSSGEHEKSESVNEAKKLGLGDKGVDYNDNVVEIIAMGNYNKIAKMLKKETGNDPEDYGYEKAPGNFYLTKNIKATEGNVGDIAMYPVKYDMGNYWGLDPLKESINEEYIESMDSIEIANALGKIKTLWDTWKGGPMTEPSDVKPAQRELKGWMDRWFKQNIK